MPNAENDAGRSRAIVCRTCGHALTDWERDNLDDQCEPCVTPPEVGERS